MPATICSICQKEIPPSPFPITTGYGLDKDNNKVCYECCAEGDKQFMRDHGKITLYLTNVNRHPERLGSKPYHSHYRDYADVSGDVSNWPGSLKFPNRTVKVGSHNIAGKRYDVWFVFESTIWHGVRYGDNTEICHCQRTKRTA